MRYYSDVTSKLYDSPEALAEAEAAVKAEQARVQAEQEKKANERKERAAVVEQARQAMVEAQKNYRVALENFCKDYGNYHYSLKARDLPSLFDNFFNLF